MKFKKAVGKIHLWLGLASGLLVCFLGITGCMLVFEKEIERFIAPYQFVAPQQKSYLAPSQLKAAAERSLGNDRKAISIEYGSRNKAALAYYYNAKEYLIIYLNPYTGAVLKRKNMNHDFFRFIINGHYYLWLPREIGQPIVASATLIFVVMMISGLILWWPKNKAARKQRFSVKWSAKWRRVNYDVHSVLGFYMTWVSIFIALSGLVMGFQWFAKTVYWTSSGGKSLPEYVGATSDTMVVKPALLRDATDMAWQQTLPLLKDNESLSVTFPAFSAAPIDISINHRPGTYYNQDVYHYDQYTLRPLTAQGVFSGSYAQAPVAAKLSRMNYDIHVGSIGGLFTKILAFFGSLIAASLPVTGFILWRGRNKKKKVIV